MATALVSDLVVSWLTIAPLYVHWREVMNGLVVVRIGAEAGELNRIWEQVAPALGRLLAELALQNVGRDGLVMLDTDGGKLIVTKEETWASLGI